jgi:hypothetical protein
VSEATATNQQEKATKIRRKPKHENSLQPTFAAVRHNATGGKWAGDHAMGGSILQGRAAVRSIPDNAETVVHTPKPGIQLEPG